MKKVLLLCVTIAISISAMAQFKESYPKGFRKANAPSYMKRGDILVPKRRDVIDNQIQQNQATPVATPVLRTSNSVMSVTDVTEVVGTTKYDLQTNNSVSNRLVWSPDGSISAVWTFSPDANASANPPYPFRGTGYNYYDPNTQVWNAQYPIVPTQRSENSRTGFTNIVVTPSGHEMTIAHQAVTNTTYNRLAINYRATKGTGTWALSSPWGSGGFDTWSKAVGGITNENVYVIWNGSGAPATTTSPANIVNGQEGPVKFGRSTDGGVTWDAAKYISEIDSSFYCGFGGDCYSIDAQGDNVAITVGDTYTDIVLLKSNDGGNTWTKTIIWKHPIPHYGCIDTVTKYMPWHIAGDTSDHKVDTIHSHGGDAKVLLDMNNMAHVVWSEFDYHDAIATDEFYNPHMGTDNLYYWNESMGPDTTTVWDTITYGHCTAVAIAAAEDFSGNGLIDTPTDTFPNCTNYYGWGNYQTGITAMPSLGMDELGNIYISYQTINELADTTNFHMAHRHMYLVAIPIINNLYDPSTVTHPHNMILMTADGGDGENEECVFGTLARRVDFAGKKALCLYQADPVPGHSLAADGSCEKTNNLSVLNQIRLARIDLAQLNIGVDEIASSDVQIGQNYPNPANETTNIAINLKKNADVKIEVADILGNIVYKESKGKLAIGSHILTVNTASFAQGVYTYTVVTGDVRSTRKMIVN
jgi:hypothetical protein